MIYYLITIPLTFFIMHSLASQALDKNDPIVLFVYPVLIPFLGNVMNSFIYHGTGSGGIACWFIMNVALLIWWVGIYWLGGLFFKGQLLKEGASFGVIAIALINPYGIFSF